MDTRTTMKAGFTLLYLTFLPGLPFSLTFFMDSCTTPLLLSPSSAPVSCFIPQNVRWKVIDVLFSFSFSFHSQSASPMCWRALKSIASALLCMYGHFSFALLLLSAALGPVVFVGIRCVPERSASLFLHPLLPLGLPTYQSISSLPFVLYLLCYPFRRSNPVASFAAIPTIFVFMHRYIHFFPSSRF